MNAVTIIAGGWSASLVDLRKLPGFVIAVNDAAIYAPRIDAVLSMDRLWMENRFEKVSKFGKPVHLRRQALKGPHHVAKWLDHVRLFDCDHTSIELSDEAGRLNGTHSGFCALNLAYQMRPAEIYLVGFDMRRGPRGEQHWYPPYPWSKNSSGAGRLHEWSTQWTSAALQLHAAGIRTYIAGGKNIERSPFLSVSKADLEGRCATAA